MGRGDTTQTWQLPSIAIDGPFGTASEVKILECCNIIIVFHNVSKFQYFILYILGTCDFFMY